MSQFKIHTIESAPEAAQEALKAVQNANGFIPNLIGVLANALLHLKLIAQSVALMVVTA